MWVTVVFLIIFVQVIQWVFNWWSRRIDKRLDQPVSGLLASFPAQPSRFHRLSLGIPASV